MLTLLFAAAAVWTLFWFVMLVLDWGDRTSFTDSKALCSTCAKAMSDSKSDKTNEAKQFAPSTTQPATQPKTAPATAPAPTKAPAQKPATTGSESNAVDASANVANFADAQAAAKKAAQDSIVKTPVDDKHDQANVTPLFEAPSEKDDLKTIKGIGVVMERTLNDLGITTFKQLAGFQQAEVKMVSDVLSESKAGFGDRIERDEWVDQAKSLVKKAG